MSTDLQNARIRELIFTERSFSRLDEGDDSTFYQRERLVSHLDSRALATIEHVIGSLVVEPRPRILDLMASWDSHIPSFLEAKEVVGLGLNEAELQENPALTRRVLHDLNANPQLPFADETFDVVLNTVSVDYLKRPLEVFEEVARVLKPGGLFLVLFSNRMFPQKVVRLWKESSEDERVMLVEDFFSLAGDFEETKLFLSKGRPRPRDDKYAETGLPSDPVYAVYADKKGGEPGMRRPNIEKEVYESLAPSELRARESRVAETHTCPHCGQQMRAWRVPPSPFAEWDTDHLFICFNDECPYLLRGWDVMADQGNVGFSYRMMYNPASGGLGPVPVPSLRALRDGIIDEGEDLRP